MFPEPHFVNSNGVRLAVSEEGAGPAANRYSAMMREITTSTHLRNQDSPIQSTGWL